MSAGLDVDASRIALRGSSFSGGIALIAGALDPRIKLVISQVPFIWGSDTRERIPAALFNQIFVDRGQTTSSEPTHIPIYLETLEEARNPSNEKMMGTEECFRHYEELRTMAPVRDNKITLQSLFHALRSEPKEYVRKLSPKPVFKVVARQDCLINPRLQIDGFKTAEGPKELLTLDCGHFDVYRGGHLERNLPRSLAFWQNTFSA